MSIYAIRNKRSGKEVADREGVVDTYESREAAQAELDKFREVAGGETDSLYEVVDIEDEMVASLPRPNLSEFEARVADVLTRRILG